MPRPLGLRAVQILAAIRDGAAYGLDIVARAGLPSGTVYPTLGRLRRRGLIRSRWEEREAAHDAGRPRRRYYRLTPEGAEALEEGTARIRRAAEGLDRGALEEPGGGAVEATS